MARGGGGEVKEITFQLLRVDCKLKKEKINKLLKPVL